MFAAVREVRPSPTCLCPPPVQKQTKEAYTSGARFRSSRRCNQKILIKFIEVLSLFVWRGCAVAFVAVWSKRRDLLASDIERCCTEMLRLRSVTVTLGLLLCMREGPMFEN